MSLPPVVITNFSVDSACPENDLVKAFLLASTADEQLSILKQILSGEKSPADLNSMKLLAVAFFYSEAKHPVKCFLIRHITKSKYLQGPFIDFLSAEITSHLKPIESYSYETYIDIIPKIVMCLENFPAGTSAVENVVEQLSLYMVFCLSSCSKLERNNLYLSAMEKNAVHTLVHQSLRILLHIISKVNWKPDDYTHNKILDKPYFQNDLKIILNNLLNDKDVPMDTKFLCGLVAVALNYYSSELHYEAWRDLIYETDKRSEEVQLAMYSAIITTVPMQRLQEKESFSHEESAPIVTIVQNLMDIVERGSSDGVLILGVSRALLALSRGLRALRPALGAQLADSLLSFVWAHLDHYADSVRHHAAQILTATVQYCAGLDQDGSELLERALGALGELGELGAGRRGFLAGVRGVARALPAARALAVAPPARLLPALLAPDLASATASALDELLTRHARECDTRALHDAWVAPVLRFARERDLPPEVLTLLENLLSKAAQLDQNLVTYILPHISEACEEGDPKNVLVLCSVARAGLDNSHDHERWGGVLPYSLLLDAVLDARDEVRLTALGLVCAGAGRGARGAARGEVRVALQYIAYCGDEHPHARQKARPMLHKLVKRLLGGLARGAGGECAAGLAALRGACVAGLARGAGLARRAAALDLLREIELAPLPYNRTWEPDYVEKLLLHLEDKYETNKALALDILMQVPPEVLKEKYSVSLRLEDIISQANELRPTESASAAYKLELVWRRLPDTILQGNTCCAAEPALYVMLSALVAALSPAYDATRAPGDGPCYGLLHCAARLLDRLPPEAIAGCRQWEVLLERAVHRCWSLAAEAGGVVNCAAPEGALPPDCISTDYGNNAGVWLEDGRQVTAQMVLLCAWRTVKEGTAVLGSVGARLQLNWMLLCQMADWLSSALLAARHRGAFEQIYVAFQRLLHRMWRDDRPQVSAWPARRLRDALPPFDRQADRRGAGLPFFILALVSTEVGPGAAGSGLRRVMGELLARAAGAGAGVGEGADVAANDRALACNVLRALFRESSLESSVQGFVGEGLRVALQGFEGASWAERNSSTLLLSALVTRVFGVARDRVALSPRNRMAGRVFFLRYPLLYDLMLNKCKEVNESEEKLLLCPSLHAVLLLLGRLYPSPRDAADSNLKLVSFVPYVVACARSRVQLTRRLAAAAAPPLIAPDRYVSHLQYLFELASDPSIERNYCHGLLLQISALLDHKPPGVECRSLGSALPCSLRLLAPPCYPVLHQYVLVLTALHDRFPETLRQETIAASESRLRAVLFESRAHAALGGRDPCLAACLRLLLRLRLAASDAADLLLRAMQHEVSDVCSAALDYLLALHGRPAAEADSEADWEPARADTKADPAKAAVLSALRLRTEYLPALAAPLHQRSLWTSDPQRAYKHLEALVAERGSQELVISALQQAAAPLRRVLHPVSGDVVLSLASLLAGCPEPASHLVLESLVSYVCTRLEDLSAPSLTLAALVLRDSCVATRPRALRDQAARALRDHAPVFMLRAKAGDEREAFAVESALLAALAELLRAEPPLRATAALAVLQLTGHGDQRSVVPSYAGALLREHCSLAQLTALALCGAPSEHPPADQRRVFEPREQELLLGEELVWAAACADRLVELCARKGVDPLAQVARVVQEWDLPPYFDVASKYAIVDAAAGKKFEANPVVELFVQKLKKKD